MDARPVLPDGARKHGSCASRAHLTRTPNAGTAMKNDYQDPPVNTGRGRASTWIALLLIALVLGFIIWFSIAHWGPGDARHEAHRASPDVQRLTV